MDIAMESHNQHEEAPPETKEVTRIQFPLGIVGFPRSRNYELIADPKFFPFFKLVSQDEENVAFALMDPWLVKDDYQFNLSDVDMKNLCIEDEKDLQVFSIVIIFQKKKQLSLNLAAPVIVNRKENIGTQVILDDVHLPMQFMVDFS